MKKYVFIRKECYCGNGVVSDKQIDDSYCNLSCSFNSSQVCGGNDAYAMWAIEKCNNFFL